METTINLTNRDICQAIADSFDTDLKNVSLIVEETWEGYGPTEHKAHKVRATVRLKGRPYTSFEFLSERY